jgi:hypothetical protein
MSDPGVRVVALSSPAYGNSLGLADRFREAR